MGISTTSSIFSHHQQPALSGAPPANRTSQPDEALPLDEFSFKGSDHIVHGRVLQLGVKTDPSFEDEKVHTYSRTGDGQIVELKFSDLQQARGAQHAAKGKKTEADPIEERQEQLGDVRAEELASGKAADLGRAIPKDASFHPSGYIMYADRNEQVSQDYAQRMALVGQVEGFQVEVMTPGGDSAKMLKKLALDNVTVTATNASAETWSEDYGERTFKGGVIVPAYLEDPDLVSRAVNPDRVHRLYGENAIPKGVSDAKLAKLIPKKWPHADFSMHGAVSQGNYQQMLIGAATSHNWKVRECFSHLEGGNLLTGTLPNGEGYALVGKDSLAVSREKLASDLGRKVSNQETVDMIAQDLGVDAKNVHAIEQPGEFHLDMRILAAAPGQVILNDARAAYQVQAGWAQDDHASAKPQPPKNPTASATSAYNKKLKGWERQGKTLTRNLAALKAEAEKRAVWEDMSAADLQAAGLRVDRMPAIFMDVAEPEKDIANFVNGRGGINDQGERFFVGLGSDDRSEAFAAKQLLQTLPTGFNRVHFLDKNLTQETLDLAGGIKCRTKPMGTEATLAELITPYPSQLYQIHGSTGA